MDDPRLDWRIQRWNAGLILLSGLAVNQKIDLNWVSAFELESGRFCINPHTASWPQQYRTTPDELERYSRTSLSDSAYKVYERLGLDIAQFDRVYVRFGYSPWIRSVNANDGSLERGFCVFRAFYDPEAIAWTPEDDENWSEVSSAFDSCRVAYLVAGVEEPRVQDEGTKGICLREDGFRYLAVLRHTGRKLLFEISSINSEEAGAFEEAQSIDRRCQEAIRPCIERLGFGDETKRTAFADTDEGKLMEAECLRRLQELTWDRAWLKTRKEGE